MTAKVLVEEFIDGQEVEVAVLGNENPFASVCGEIDAGADFYDYEAKYISDCANLYIPARISEEASEQRARDGRPRLSGDGLPRAFARGLLCDPRAAGGRLQRDQHHPGLHVDLDVSEAL